MTTATTTDDALQAPAVGRYAIDRRASTITFKSRHLFGLTPVHGTMAIGGGLVDSADPLTGSSVQVEIDTTSFDTGTRQRDRDVRSSRFLAIERSTVPPEAPTSFVVWATTRIDRTDFGLTAAKGLAGRHLDISLRIQGVRR